MALRVALNSHNSKCTIPSFDDVVCFRKDHVVIALMEGGRYEQGEQEVASLKKTKLKFKYV